MAKKKAPRGRSASASTPMTAPQQGVKIRMYRQGLGDAFLLAFRGKDGEPRYVLIDCGVHMSQTGGRKRMTAVVEDIRQATGGHIHIIVATHEHADHLSGFVQEHAQFSGMTIDELWRGWTEADGDPVADQLRKRHGHSRRVIEAALKKLEASKPKNNKRTNADRQAAERAQGFMAFFGLESAADLAAAAGAAGVKKNKATANEVAYALLRKCVGAGGERCFRPGSLAAIPGVPDVRVYVLGPPEDQALLGQADPSSGSASEVYFQTAGLDEAGAFAAALNALDPTALEDVDPELLQLTYPFDACHRLSYDKLADDESFPFFRDRYGFSKKPGAFENEHKEGWRRIETDWLRPAADLALSLDKATNNTSLALAFELPGGEVLLFPGDAQVGSWISWGSLRWKVGGKEVTVDDLFARTVLYKVGHHASHNGTLKALGLEKMSDDLIALIPVDQEAAAKLPGWHMPYKPLYARLQDKTGGRVLRSDEDCALLKTRAKKPPQLSAAQWQAFRDTVGQTWEQGAGYYELTVGG